MDVQFLLATSTELEVAIKSYLTHLKGKRRSESTREKYGGHLERLRVWLAERGVVEFRAVTWLLLEEWLAECQEKWQPATVKQAVAGARGLVKYASERRWIDKAQEDELLRSLKPPKVPKNPQRTLSMGEIETLIAGCDLATAKGVRDAALVALLTDSGFRATETCRIKVSEVQLGYMLMPGVVINRIVTRVKGGKEAPGYFGKRTEALLRAWLAIRAEFAAPGVVELFVSVGGNSPGQPLTRQGLKAIVRKLGLALGVANVSPHAFRRSFACLLDLAGASTRTIQELGRWEELEMVLLYTRDLQAAQQYNRVAPMDFLARLLGPGTEPGTGA